MPAGDVVALAGELSVHSQFGELDHDDLDGLALAAQLPGGPTASRAFDPLFVFLAPQEAAQAFRGDPVAIRCDQLTASQAPARPGAVQWRQVVDGALVELVRTLVRAGPGLRPAGRSGLHQVTRGKVEVIQNFA